MTEYRRQMRRNCLVAALLLLSTACSPDEPAVDTAAEHNPRTSREEIQEIYLRSCHSCHATGVAGAPRTGDTDAWVPRLEQGMDTLVTHVEKGYQAMPPRGLCFDCTREEYAALIRFMAEDRDQ